MWTLRPVIAVLLFGVIVASLLLAPLQAELMEDWSYRRKVMGK